ncbi:MAG: hypothetical protein B7Y80_18775 [Hyphomicrobium sp. 32-62-53]|nr:MAG: hypothetical protein B7Z29_17465 [Hyphomicrobium sp. 12-62-95]OYX97665.1 MAG: hypothetical protein B7Y80_18775 [Hyphomicrobium sp. 32-62-53]
MNLTTALALVIGALGAVATWLFLGPLAALGLQIWVAFIAWASFYHCGGGEAGLKNSISGGIWGAIMATVAFVLMPLVGMGTLGTALCVGATVAIMIMGAHSSMLSAIPAAVYGYAATAAFTLLKSGAAPLSTDIATSPLLNVGLSLIIGVLFGYASERLATSLAGSGAAIRKA